MLPIFNIIVNKYKSVFSPTPEPASIKKPARDNSVKAFPRYGSPDKFPGGISSRRTSEIIHDHLTLRQQSRDAMFDSTVAKSMVDRFADTVVDTGLKVKPTPMTSVIGITPEEGEKWSENVAQLYHLWSKSKKSHTSRVNNNYQNQRLYGIFQQRDNDVFVQLTYSKEKDQINPLSYEFVEPNQVRGNAVTSSFAQIPGDDGIIRDTKNRETGYKIWEWIKNEYKERTIPARGEKSGRIFMLHGFNPEYANQGRGFPRLTHALQEFEQLTDFKQSVIKKAISQSSLSMVMENEQQDASNVFEGVGSGPLSEYGQYDEGTENLQSSALDEPIVNYNLLPEATFHDPGSVGIFNTKRGDHLNFLKDTSPSESFSTFVDSFCSHLSASTGMPLEVLLMKFNANYSASRAALILFWRVAQIWRNEMAADFLDPLYEMWLSEEIALGRVKCPGWQNPIIKEAWLSKDWSGAPMPNIDPLKTMAADRGYVEMGAQDLDDVALNYNGSSGKANRIKNARQFKEVPQPPWPWPVVTEKEDSKDKEDKEDKGDE